MNSNKKFHPIYVVAILYVVITYLLPVIFMLTATDHRPLVSSISMLLPIIMGVANTVLVLVLFPKVNRRQFLVCSMIIKYALIPFYVVGGIVIVISLLLMFTPVVVMLFMGPMVAVLFAVMGWIILIGAAPYPIAYLVHARREGVHGSVLTIVSGILQFFFTADVITLTILVIKDYRFKKKQ